METFIGVLFKAFTDPIVLSIWGFNACLYSGIFISNKRKIQKAKKAHLLSLVRDLEAPIVTLDEFPKDLINEKYTCRLDKTGIKKDASIIVNNFVKTLKKHPHINLSNFYRNFHAFCIDITPSSKKEIGGDFLGSSNNINIYTEDLEPLNHELLHMASSHILENGIKIAVSCGFKRSVIYKKSGNNYEIGRGLNEGYTALLENRYFNPTIKAYTDQLLIANIIEILVGAEKMESLYFNGDLAGLVKALKLYMHEEEAIILFKKLDFFHHISYSRFDYSEKLCKMAYTSVLIYLRDIMINSVHNFKALKDDGVKEYQEKYRLLKMVLCEISRIAHTYFSDSDYVDFCAAIDFDQYERTGISHE